MNSFHSVTIEQAYAIARTISQLTGGTLITRRGLVTNYDTIRILFAINRNEFTVEVGNRLVASGSFDGEFSIPTNLKSVLNEQQMQDIKKYSINVLNKHIEKLNNIIRICNSKINQNTKIIDKLDQEITELKSELETVTDESRQLILSNQINDNANLKRNLMNIVKSNKLRLIRTIRLLDSATINLEHL